MEHYYFPIRKSLAIEIPFNSGICLFKSCNMKLLNIVLIVSLLIFNYSCKKEASRDQPYKDVLIGSWRITEYSTTYDTSIHYVGYNLVFTADGKVQATDLNSVSLNGRWNEYSYETIPEFYVFLEFLGDELYYLNGSWTFLEYSSSQISFEIRSYGTVFTMTLSKS